MTLAIETPFVFSTVQAGFPSPADDYVEQRLDVHKHLVKKPASTLFFPAPDDSMSEFGIFLGDLVIVDRSLKPLKDKVVLVEIDGERVLRRYGLKQGQVFLAVGKRDVKCEPIDPDLGLNVVGVATCVIHHL